MLLRRYGVVFRDLLARETAMPRWRELLGIFRRMEARGEVRGGRFLSGFGGEQFALPEAVESLREMRTEAEPVPSDVCSGRSDESGGYRGSGRARGCVPGKTVTYPLPAAVEEPAEASVATDLFAFGAAAVEGGALA